MKPGLEYRVTVSEQVLHSNLLFATDLDAHTLLLVHIRPHHLTFSEFKSFQCAEIVKQRSDGRQKLLLTTPARASLRRAIPHTASPVASTRRARSRARTTARAKARNERGMSGKAHLQVRYLLTQSF